MTAAQLARLTLGDAEEGWRVGTITQTEYEAYRRAWARGGGQMLGYRAAAGWTSPGPADVEQLAEEILYVARNGRERLPFEAAA